MNAKGKKSNLFMKYSELEDKRREEEQEKNEISNRRTNRIVIQEEYDKTEESNKVAQSEREIDKEKDRLEAELREKQDRLKKLIREKNLLERNLEDKYEKELQSKKNLMVILLSILIFLVCFLIFQSFYL